MRTLLAILLLFLPAVSHGDQPIVCRPVPIELQSTDAGDGWTQWDGIADVEGAAGYRERAVSLHVDADDQV